MATKLTHTLAVTTKTFEWFENAKRYEQLDQELTFTNDEFIMFMLDEYPKPNKKKNYR